MEKRMVSAFKQEVEGPAVPSIEEKIKETILMHPKRQDILEYLCRYPCSRLSKISRDLDLTKSTVKWHLEMLIKKNFISQEIVDGNNVFFPTEMIDENDITVLSLLNNSQVTTLLRAVHANPGISHSSLCKTTCLNSRTITKHSSTLEEFGFLNCIKDGKFKRYYPTELVRKMDDAYRKKTRHFRNILIKALKKDGVNPTIMRSTSYALHVKITAGIEKKVLELNIRPLSSILEVYKGL